jgi:serine/threonine-protein kinase
MGSLEPLMSPQAQMHAPQPALQRRDPKDVLVEGQMCGQYEIETLIGGGGYGAVYKARGPSDELVAVKVTDIKHAADPHAGQRMLLEARILKMLNHPNVVGYRAWQFLDDDFIWIAMEFLFGKTLRELIQACGRLSLPLACHLIRQSCLGLQAAHDRKIVHRDIKPENLFCCVGEVAKVLDFGVARDEQIRTGSSTIVGTPLYLCLDYLRKGPRVPANPVWDLQAMAFTFYECATGWHPLNPNKEELTIGAIIERHLLMHPPPLAEILPHCPERLSRCIERGMAKNIEDSWPSAAAMAEELLACQALFAPRDVDPMAHFDALAPAILKGRQPVSAPQRPLSPIAPTVSTPAPADSITVPQSPVVNVPVALAATERVGVIDLTPTNPVRAVVAPASVTRGSTEPVVPANTTEPIPPEAIAEEIPVASPSPIADPAESQTPPPPVLAANDQPVDDPRAYLEHTQPTHPAHHASDDPEATDAPAALTAQEMWRLRCEFAVQLEEALKALSPEDHRFHHLHCVEDRPLEEVAAAFGYDHETALDERHRIFEHIRGLCPAMDLLPDPRFTAWPEIDPSAPSTPPTTIEEHSDVQAFQTPSPLTDEELERIRSDFAQELQRALDSLNPQERRFRELIVREKQPLEDVAAAFGYSYEAAVNEHRRMNRAFRQLCPSLESLIEHDPRFAAPPKIDFDEARQPATQEPVPEQGIVRMSDVPSPGLLELDPGQGAPSEQNRSSQTPWDAPPSPPIQRAAITQGSKRRPKTLPYTPRPSIVDEVIARWRADAITAELVPSDPDRPSSLGIRIESDIDDVRPHGERVDSTNGQGAHTNANHRDVDPPNPTVPKARVWLRNADYLAQSRHPSAIAPAPLTNATPETSAASEVDPRGRFRLFTPEHKWRQIPAFLAIVSLSFVATVYFLEWLLR